MKTFINDDFLLFNKTARLLYHDYAEPMPIIDYHNHLPPAEIAENRQFENLTSVWLYGDHYKWRAMRANGINERYITGQATDKEKFIKWAETVPKTLRNPLYHWTHLELLRYFGMDELLDATSAMNIYDSAKEKLQSKDFSVWGLLTKMNVEKLCTTDDPVDTLEHHRLIQNSEFTIKVIPAWRPDKAMAAEEPLLYNQYLDKLSAAAGKDIATYRDLIEALKKRHDFFHEAGCRLSDHGIETFYAEDYTMSEIENIFVRIRSGHALSGEEILKLKSALLFDLAVMDFEKGWVQQFHAGPLRNNNKKQFKALGPDTGFDSIGDFRHAQPMAKFLSRLDEAGKLTKTILYNINPADNEVFATMAGNFNDGSVPGKVQWGSAWWFLDQKDGIEKQLNVLSNMGLLSRFVGMLTDSRSFLSFPRHEYFRRVLCNLIGEDVEKGLLPNDQELLGNMIRDISYYNAKQYFDF
jgi:glucuronate isomerase